MTCNLRGTLTLWKDGRGDYLGALNSICALEKGEEITLGGDGDFSDDFRNDFRNSMLVGFYARYVKNCGRFVYYRRGTWTTTAPAWVLAVSFGSDRRWAQKEIASSNGDRLLLQGFYPSVELSGWNWSVYRRVVATPGSKPTSSHTGLGSVYGG